MKGNMFKIIALIMGLIAATAMAKSKNESIEVTRTKSSTTMYKTEQGEDDKVSDVGGGEDVTLIKEGKSRSLIKTSGSLKGWVDNSSLQKVKVSSGGTHNLKDVEVVGWLDNPSAVYILDNTNPDVNALPLDRSFSTEIVEKKDREEVERTYDEN